ncbi:MAG: ribbon-helix-helix domain-containing protein [Candidatus Hadarchaeales archaeon]
MKTRQILLKLPEKLFERMDEIVVSEGYTSYQELIRELIRDRIRPRSQLDMVEEEIHARRRRIIAEKIQFTPTSPVQPPKG